MNATTVPLLTAIGLSVAFTIDRPKAPAMEFEALTPIIFVDEIEPCIPFWTDLGFANIGEVPHDDKLGFVMLQKDGAMVMSQSYASAMADVPEVVQRPLRSTTALYVRMTGFEELLQQLATAEVVIGERTTFYGAREIFVRAPCETVVGFAEMQEDN